MSAKMAHQDSTRHRSIVRFDGFPKQTAYSLRRWVEDILIETIDTLFRKRVTGYLAIGLFVTAPVTGGRIASQKGWYERCNPVFPNR